MRHQIRLLDQNLPGLARELALACGRVVDPRAGAEFYRGFYRAVRDVLRSRVQAFRYCGSTNGCEHALKPGEQVIRFRHEAVPGERIHVYLTAAEVTPAVLVRELATAATRAAAHARPGEALHGVARSLRARVEETLRGRLFQADTCGDLPLCGMNEPYDPWDRADPANAVLRRAPAIG